MNRSALHLVVRLGVAAITSASHAGIVNPSFEDVYPSPHDPFVVLPVGWTTVVTEEGFDTAWAEKFGEYGAPPAGPTDGRAMAIVTAPWRIWQTVTLTAGERIFVDVAVATSSSQAYGSAVIALGSSWNEPALWNFAASASLDVPYPGNFGSGGVSWIGWQTLSLTVPATGTYDLVLIGGFSGTANGGTNTYFDNIRVIPAPGTAALLVLGRARLNRRRR
ncbi:MAG: hypothetical protein K2W85_16695 [Phycisphaerales bacterium]|nr:hypothetical protein [Phycisphaerales bacterium]